MNLNEVRQHINEEEHYVLYRLPNEKRGHLISAHHIQLHDQIPDNLSLLGNCFIFAPFSTEKHKILAIPSEKSIDFELKEEAPNIIQESSISAQPDASYEKAFRHFLSAIQEKRFQKLVLSRSQKISIPKQDEWRLFNTVCVHYPNAMVYLLHSSHTGNWLGASPELLLSGDDAQLRTIALAGTKKNQGEKSVPLEKWGEKERMEQKIVADFIRERIACHGTCKDEWGPYSVSAGHISHLRTDFYLFMEKKMRAPFLKSIHPTPAVCGLPKEESQQFISAHEGLDRSYFSGYYGPIDPNGKMDLYVNLRCMNFTDDTATLYAGGGILATSDLSSEWNETEEKMNTLKRLLL